MDKETSLLIDIVPAANMSRIDVNGSVADISQLLAETAASILDAYFPGNMEKQLAWAITIAGKTMQEINNIDDNEEDENNEEES